MTYCLRSARALLVSLLLAGCFASDDDPADASRRDAGDAAPASGDTASALDASSAESHAHPPADAPLGDSTPDAGAGAGDATANLDTNLDTNLDSNQDGGPPVGSDAAAWQPDGRPHDLRPRCSGSGEVDGFATVQAFQDAIAGLWWPCAGDFTKNWDGMPVELTADGKWFLLEPTTSLARRTGPDTSGIYRARPWPTNPGGLLQAFDGDFFSEPNEASNVHAAMTTTRDPRMLQIGDLFYQRVTRAP